jgi:hypothetical protein
MGVASQSSRKEACCGHQEKPVCSSNQFKVKERKQIISAQSGKGDRQR